MPYINRPERRVGGAEGSALLQVPTLEKFNISHMAKTWHENNFCPSTLQTSPSHSLCRCFEINLFKMSHGTNSYIFQRRYNCSENTNLSLPDFSHGTNSYIFQRRYNCSENTNLSLPDFMNLCPFFQLKISSDLDGSQEGAWEAVRKGGGYPICNFSPG